MEKPIGYVIKLSGFADSVAWSQHAYDTARSHGWHTEFFEGTDGRQQTLADFGIKIYPDHKKCVKYMQRPGTQGCFLSHWRLWSLCRDQDRPIMVFEHDVEFLCEPPTQYDFQHVLKLEGFRPSKPIPAGQWWEGARAYVITPLGADRILNWVQANGAMPADWMLCDGIVDVKFDLDRRVQVRQNQFSFTRDLQ
jgi:GR25 family glycosyltransferase involved in LPS biosynthesis